MKKLIIALVAAIFSTSSHAQIQAGEFSMDKSTVYYGVRLGLNVANITGDQETLSSKAGLNFGAVVGLRISETTPLFIESGLYYTQRGAEKNRTEVNLNYLEIPILIKAGFNVTDDIAVLPFIGPTFAVGISGKQKGYKKDDKGVETFYSEKSFGSNGNYKRGDMGIKLGCGAEWNMLYAELGYQFGVANILDSDEFTQHGNALFLNIGVNF
ncbi:MAG: PorT family protein [Prevotella sp.]|nr:PorT family protein [Prevotella sp.]